MCELVSTELEGQKNSSSKCELSPVCEDDVGLTQVTREGGKSKKVYLAAKDEQIQGTCPCFSF